MLSSYRADVFLRLARQPETSTLLYYSYKINKSKYLDGDIECLVIDTK